MDRVKLAIESLQTHIDYDKRAYGMQTGAIIIGIAEAEAMLELLKEQEAVEPITVGNDYRQWRCPKCRDRLRYRLDKFCPHCGREVKWE